jgi:hypothetical protein
MKTKQLLTVISFTALPTASMAQVKIGSNPTTIKYGANLNVETSNNSHTVVMQSGAVDIHHVTLRSPPDIRGDVKVLANTGTQTGNTWNGTSKVSGFEVCTGAGGDVWVSIERAGGFPYCIFPNQPILRSAR